MNAENQHGIKNYWALEQGYLVSNLSYTQEFTSSLFLATMVGTKGLWYSLSLPKDLW